MGGINCNSPSNIHLDPASSRVMGEYVYKLANYSANLFGGVSAFFDANTKIENSVLGVSCIDTALEAMKSCEDLIKNSRTNLTPVASLWSMVAPNECVNFVLQDSNLGVAIQAVHNARIELENLPKGNNLQNVIWANPSITDNMVAASNALAIAVSWQVEFATLSSNLAAIAA